MLKDVKFVKMTDEQQLVAYQSSMVVAAWELHGNGWTWAKTTDDNNWFLWHHVVTRTGFLGKLWQGFPGKAFMTFFRPTQSGGPTCPLNQRNNHIFGKSVLLHRERWIFWGCRSPVICWLPRVLKVVGFAGEMLLAPQTCGAHSVFDVSRSAAARCSHSGRGSLALVHWRLLDWAQQMFSQSLRQCCCVYL